jgi:hypothetical protein
MENPMMLIRTLCRTLARTFDRSNAEVTLEGVPAAFLNRTPLLVDVLREEIPARHFRADKSREARVPGTRPPVRLRRT